MAARTLTLLFTDLAGSTREWSGLDRAASDRRRARHFVLMRSDLATHGGREVKNLGDGLMAVFESAAPRSRGSWRRFWTVAQSALPGLALDGVGSALDREFSGADWCPAGCAYRQRVKLGSAGVFEDDGLPSGVHVVVAPFLQRENDRT